MKKSSNDTNWRAQYTIVALAGLIYIILLGLFTWLFNHSL